MSDPEGPPRRTARGREGEFRKALTKLSTDAGYREQALTQPNLITTDFKLSLTELEALRQAAIMSGADVRNVDRVRADLISMVANSDELERISISCCTCCCCCCGETAVAPLIV